MFLRRVRVRKNGKAHRYWALVKCVRTPRGPRQELVSYLGELRRGCAAPPQGSWPRLPLIIAGGSRRETIRRRR